MPNESAQCTNKQQTICVFVCTNISSIRINYTILISYAYQIIWHKNSKTVVVVVVVSLPKFRFQKKMLTGFRLTRASYPLGVMQKLLM